MITSNIGKIFLNAYNRKYQSNYDAKSFFIEKYYPLFFDNSKYLMWVQNSPFVQMKKGQKVDTLTKDERRDKLNELISKIDNGYTDASIALGYPASELKEFATTSGQVSSIDYNISKDDIYLSWIGASLGLGLQGGVSILFDNEDILLDIYDGWKYYRECINNDINIRGNQVASAWNAQWLTHRYSYDYVESAPISNFDPFDKKDGSVKTQAWVQLIIGIAKKYNSPRMMGYVYSFGQTNTTIGFIPFFLDQIRNPIDLYSKFFGLESGRLAEKLWGTAYGLIHACQAGAIGLKSMEPKGLKEFIKNGKLPNNKENEININIIKIWIMAMLNEELLWDKAQELAKVLYDYSLSSSRGKSDSSNKVKSLLEATNKDKFLINLSIFLSDAKSSELTIFIDNMLPIFRKIEKDNFPFFLSLVKLYYTINITK